MKVSKNSIRKSLQFVALVLVAFGGWNAQAKNLHLIDQEKNGFAIYRTGAPDANDMKKFCKIGIQEMMVLSGNADAHEEKYRAACPSLKVIYNLKQSPTRPVSAEFLTMFTNWVEQAQRDGKKIAFRCSCGCHRTGRLAAFYQMKYQNITSTDAIAIMNKHGKYMFIYPSLPDQVRAMEDYINGRECSVEKKLCIMDEREQERFEYPEFTEESEGAPLR